MVNPKTVISRVIFLDRVRVTWQSISNLEPDARERWQSSVKLWEVLEQMQAMLLAAGFGTRLHPYSLLRPKPLFPVLNKPLLSGLIDMLHEAGCERIIVNGHHLSHLVAEAVAGIPGLVFQHEPVILGTGGSLRKALAHCAPGPLLVMNGDIFHDIDIRGLYRHHLKAGNDVTMALHDYDRFNTVAVREGTVVSFRQARAGGTPERLAYTGIQVVNPEIVRRIPPGCFSHIIDLYEELILAGGRIGYTRVDGRLWRDIGAPEEYLGLHGELLMRSGSRRRPGARTRDSWLIDNGAVLGGNITFSGWGCLGRAVVGAGVFLRNCVVWDNAVIPADTRLENAIVPGPSG